MAQALCLEMLKSAVHRHCYHPTTAVIWAVPNLSQAEDLTHKLTYLQPQKYEQVRILILLY